MMEVPQLHGFGPAANRLLEAYNTLLKVILECLVCFLAILFHISCFLLLCWPTDLHVVVLLILVLGIKTV